MRNKVFGVIISVVFIYSLLYPFIRHSDVEVVITESEPTIEVQEPVIEELPLHNVELPNFGSILDIKAKKAVFFDFMLPYVRLENEKILEQRATLEIAYMMLQIGEELTATQQEKVRHIFSLYELPLEDITLNSLTIGLSHVDIIPEQLALMQAANESAWGTSRFARIGLNFFGQWCYSAGCGMVPKRRANEAEHEVQAFNSVSASVSSYFRNINTHYAYAELREIRATLREEKRPLKAEALTIGLIAYSERGALYVNELNDMIRQNKGFFDEH